MNEIEKVVIVPSDPISAYENCGYSSWLERYYNPAKTFKNVYLVSPLENGVRNAYGATIIGCNNSNFKQTINEIQPNVIRAYGGFWPSDLVIANKVNGIPTMISLHDSSLELMHDSILQADMLVCMTKFVQEQAVRKGVDVKKTRILPNRIDTSIFYRRNEINDAIRKFPEGKALLHVGRKSNEKNIETVIKSLKYLPQEYFAVFVGRGDTREYILLANRNGVSERCFWVDKVDNSELPLWYSWCQCMLTPSLREGFGIVFIEAMACGANVVSSNIAPLNEYMKNGFNATLVDDYLDPEKIAIAVLKSENSEYFEMISRNAIESSQGFSVEKIDDMEKNLYMECIHEYSKKR